MQVYFTGHVFYVYSVSFVTIFIVITKNNNWQQSIVFDKVLPAQNLYVNHFLSQTDMYKSPIGCSGTTLLTC